jgi:D-proline reductase (dithiol) PrdB
LELSPLLFFHPGKEPEGVPTLPPKQPYAAPSDPMPENLNTNDVSWDKEATDMDDLGSYLPLETLKGKISEKKVGSVSKRFYGIPTDYSQRRTLEDANQILNWCRDDDVDALLLVPV